MNDPRKACSGIEAKKDVEMGLLWCGPRFSAFDNADMTATFTAFACIVVFWKITFHLTEFSKVSQYDLN